MEKQMVEHLVEEQFGRVKGASWFSGTYKKEVMVLGQGGIGSWLTLLLARAGCYLHTFDMDHFENHNMTGQLVSEDAIGRNKAEAVAEVVKQFSPNTSIFTYGEFTAGSPINDIVICGFDKMNPRRLAFEKWRKEYGENPYAFFQDGRLLAEQLQIISIPGGKPELLEQYEKEYLFTDDEAEEGDCTFKQTSHVAAMIAGKMVGFFTNWVSNIQKGKEIRKVPFFDQYVVPLNM